MDAGQMDKQPEPITFSLQGENYSYSLLQNSL